MKVTVMAAKAARVKAARVKAARVEAAMAVMVKAADLLFFSHPQ
ncbi:hypothetical protein [Mastigocoleus sp. MO_188.B34]|nr:hypothetical protein [Mastigocoleus sp. MO_188.B34]